MNYTNTNGDDFLDELEQWGNDQERNEEQRIAIKAKELLKSLKQKRAKFPIDAFPKDIGFIIQNFHDAYKFPIDYYGLGILVAASSVIGNAYAAQYQTRWEACPLLFGVIIGHSGVGKSKVLKTIMAPIFEIQNQMNEEHALKMQNWRLSSLDGIASNPPKRQRVIMQKATMEAVQQILMYNPRGCVLLRQELTGWIKSMNQYRAGDDGESWLEIWDNEDIILDRVGREVFIKQANVSVLGGIQPHVIKTLAANNRSENGFLARLLFAYPSNLKKPYPSDTKAHVSIFDKYKEIIKYLHHLPQDSKKAENEFDQPSINTIPLKLSYEAQELYKQFLIDNTDALNETEDEITKAILAKLDTYCLRFCCILELLNLACKKIEPVDIDYMTNLDISINTVKNAIKLVQYFRTTAAMVTESLESPSSDLKPEYQAWYKSLPEEFGRETAINSAKTLEISERSVTRLLRNTDLFKKLRRGFYEKNHW